MNVKVDDGHTVPLSPDMVFTCSLMKELVIGVEICEDLWAPQPPSIALAKAGAILIVNLSASDETTGKDTYRKNLVAGQAGRLICGYIYADAGEGESTQDVVFAGHNIIAENGNILKESHRFKNGIIYSEIDIQKLRAERRRISTFTPREEEYDSIPFTLQITDTELTRFVDSSPFVPSNEDERKKRCEEILSIQTMGLKKRLVHTRLKSAVVGISGGLDSTLALLVTVRAFDLVGISRENIIAVTMPGFGTTDRTYDNACAMVRSLGATLKEVPIANAVRVHFNDIGHDEYGYEDGTYTIYDENGEVLQYTVHEHNEDWSYNAYLYVNERNK